MPNTHKTPTTELWCALQALDTPALREQWCTHFGTERTPRLKRELLIGALAHAIQAKAHGGLKPRIRRALINMAVNPEKPCNNSPTVNSGTRLVREWQGQTHTVEKAASGYLWQGRQFTSLSAVAREITGTRWSGPRFFGLDARGPGRKNDRLNPVSLRNLHPQVLRGGIRARLQFAACTT